MNPPKLMFHQRFGKLLVVARGPNYIKGVNGEGGTAATWVCRCDCGGEITVRGQSLRAGRSTHCGCNPAVVRRWQEYRARSIETKSP